MGPSLQCRCHDLAQVLKRDGFGHSLPELPPRLASPYPSQAAGFQNSQGLVTPKELAQGKWTLPRIRVGRANLPKTKGFRHNKGGCYPPPGWQQGQ